MNTIVTHQTVDLDAITSCWLIKRFLPGWEDAEIQFVPAGTTLDGKLPDENPSILHVDTGMGMFDHHQLNEKTCAAKRIFEYLKNNGNISQKNGYALEKLISYVVTIDHFGEIYFHDPTNDLYEFLLHQIIDHLKGILREDIQIVNHIFPLLEAILYSFRNKLGAEEEIKKGFIFTSKWGKCLAVESKNADVIKLALKQGYKCVVTKNPEKGHVRIKSFPDESIDLTPLYEKIISNDKKGDWYLHVSKHMLLNGSSKNPTLKPTALSIQKLIAIIKEI